jgi:uncharacterized protein YrrD
MNMERDEDERPLAWTAIIDRTPVYASDGTRVGAVSEVLGSTEVDVFHGIEVGDSILGRLVLIPAQHVTSISNRRISTDLSPQAIRELPNYRAEESYQLGFVGLLRRRLGWKEEGRDSP